MSVESYRESPGKFDSRTLNRKTLNRWIGRTCYFKHKRSTSTSSSGAYVERRGMLGYYMTCYMVWFGMICHIICYMICYMICITWYDMI